MAFGIGDLRLLLLLNRIAFDKIRWTGRSDTAICPFCAVDCVIGFDNKSNDQPLREAMHGRWFKIVGLTAAQWDEALGSNKWPLVSE